MPKSKKSLYSVKFVYPNDVIPFEVDDIQEAFEKFKPNPYKGRVVIQLETEGKSSNYVVIPGLIRRFLINKVFRQIVAKRLIANLT